MRIFFNKSLKERVVFTLQTDGDFEPHDLERILDGALFRVNRSSIIGTNRLEFVQELPDSNKVLVDKFLEAVHRK